MSDKKITFSGVDNGVSSMMNRMRQDSKQLANDLIKDARDYSNSSKDQLKYINEQIAAIEKRNRLEKESNQFMLDKKKAAGEISDKQYASQSAQNKNSSKEDQMQVHLLRDIIETIKNTARDEIKEDRKTATENVNAFRHGKRSENEEENLKLALQDQMMKPPKGHPGEDEKKEQNMARAFLGGTLMREAGKMIMQMPSAQTGLDMLNPSLKLGGMAVGGTTGLALNAIPGVEGAEYVGAQIGESIAGFVGTALERSLRSREAYATEALGVRAITGNQMGGPEISRYGLSVTQSSQVAQTVAIAMGRSKQLMQNTADFVAIQKGFGFDQGLVSGVYSQQRMGGGGGGSPIQQVAKAFALAQKEGLFKGGDTTSFADVIRNQTQLMSQFAETSETLKTDAGLKTLMEFNRVGGGFSLTDPRSAGRISGINGDLSNASSPFSQASNYQILRGLNPNDGIFDLQKKQQQGLQTKGFLKGVLDDITGMGGSEDFQKLMLAQRLPSLSLDAVDQLYKNRGQIDSMSEGDIGGMTGSTSNIRGRASGNVARLTKQTAEVENAFIDSFISGIKTIKNQWADEMKIATQEIGKQFKEEFDNVAKVMKEKMSEAIDVATGEGMAASGAALQNMSTIPGAPLLGALMMNAGMTRMRERGKKPNTKGKK